MTMHFRYLPLSKVAAGTLLAEDLLDKVGHVLLPAGTTLTDRMLQAIANHGIHQLSVKDTAMSPQEEKDEIQGKLQRVEKIFRHEGENEPANLLKSYVLHYRQGEPNE